MVVPLTRTATLHGRVWRAPFGWAGKGASTVLHLLAMEQTITGEMRLVATPFPTRCIRQYYLDGVLALAARRGNSSLRPGLRLRRPISGACPKGWLSSPLSVSCCFVYSGVFVRSDRVCVRFLYSVSCTMAVLRELKSPAFAGKYMGPQCAAAVRTIGGSFRLMPFLGYGTFYRAFYRA